MRPPFDPELAAALEKLPAKVPLRSLQDIPVRREAGAADVRTVAELADMFPGFTFTERFATGPAGEIPLLVVSPENPSGAGLYYLHGGGMIVGHHLGADTVRLLSWAAELNLAIVSAGYRLAPEHPHPTPVEDCYAGLLWTAEHAAELGIDRLAIGGVSAGGGLAAATVLLARDRGGPDLAAQLLIYPMLDDRNDSTSARQFEDVAGVWDREANAVGWTALLGEHREDVSPYAAPARATDLSGLPPAFLDVGSAEVFRDEVVAYANRLWEAGGEAELHVWPGGYHGFDGRVPGAALSQAAMKARLPWLRRVLSLP